MKWKREDLKQIITGIRYDGEDTLSEFYTFQKLYQRALGDDSAGIDGARRNLLSAFVELGELARELPFKWYRDGNVGYGFASERVVMELADVLAFLLNVMIHVGIDARMLREGVCATLEKNLARLESGENKKGVDGER